MGDSRNLVQEIRNCLENLKARKIVIWGACKSGELLKELLEENNIFAEFFIDKKAEHFVYKKTKIMLPEILQGGRARFFIIVAVSNYYKEIEEFLQANNYSEIKDYIYIYKPLIVNNPNNYRDMRGNEVIGRLENTIIHFGGYNNTIKVGNNISVEKSQLEIRVLSDNSTLTIGNNCYFRKNASISIQEKSCIKIGDNCIFGPSTYIVAAIDSRIDIGENSTFEDMLVVFSTFSGTVKIGEDCMASSNVTVGNNDGHVIFDVNKEIQINVKDSIIIGNHVWLGNKCTVLSGAKIGDGSIVASNGVVTKKFPNNCIVAGVPSKIIRKDIAWDRSITNATLVKDSLYWKRTEFMT